MEIFAKTELSLHKTGKFIVLDRYLWHIYNKLLLKIDKSRSL